MLSVEQRSMAFCTVRYSSLVVGAVIAVILTNLKRNVIKRVLTKFFRHQPQAEEQRLLASEFHIVLNDYATCLIDEEALHDCKLARKMLVFFVFMLHTEMKGIRFELGTFSVNIDVQCNAITLLKACCEENRGSQPVTLSQ